MKSSLPSIVQFNGVSLSYENGPDVLKDITFSLAPGSFYFLTGESGAGKSSLLSLMYLARRPTKGNLSVFGTEVNLQNREKLPVLR